MRESIITTGPLTGTLWRCTRVTSLPFTVGRMMMTSLFVSSFDVAPLTVFRHHGISHCAMNVSCVIFV